MIIRPLTPEELEKHTGDNEDSAGLMLYEVSYFDSGLHKKVLVDVHMANLLTTAIKHGMDLAQRDMQKALGLKR